MKSYRILAFKVARRAGCPAWLFGVCAYFAIAAGCMGLPLRLRLAVMPRCTLWVANHQQLQCSAPLKQQQPSCSSSQGLKTAWCLRCLDLCIQNVLIMLTVRQANPVGRTTSMYTFERLQEENAAASETLLSQHVPPCAAQQYPLQILQILREAAWHCRPL